MNPIASLSVEDPPPAVAAANDSNAAAAPAKDPWGPLRQRLLRHARVVVHEAALAEDLVQETLMAIFENPKAHNGQAALTTWAIAILKNKVADWYRSPHQRRRVHVKEDDAESSDDATESLFNAQGSRIEPVPAWEQPEGREAQRQMMTVMEGCLRRLPAQASKVFMMREWLGFESTEISERLGLSSDNTRTILHRARTGLRQCMSSQGHASGSVT
jgi:RNA polymerase sigma-70 factor (ECF subfamily)